MDFIGNQISGAMQVWDSVQSTVKNRGSSSSSLSISSKKSSRSFYSELVYITPNILALGKVSESKVDDIVKTLKGKPALVWNLSGKPFPSSVVSKLNCQVLDFPWTTPGHFTQAPSLECVCRQCYSVKAWLDLKAGNLAVIHCSNGKSRTGILIACFLRYMSSFPRTSDAFDYFCSTRLQTSVTPVLTPSYQILFENFDRTTENGGRPNPFPLHLKCLAISGLPVDDMPCLEVWNMDGLVFNSHAGMTPSRSRCAWSTEYGDGFFRVAADLVGDFSLMCRFGGSHALTRDKTTLIFKYQNSTGFLPPDVIELGKKNVDVNPEYIDSLDDSAFTIHLMFEAVNDNKANRKSIPQFTDAYQLRGKEAFETGLEEISKYHIVEPKEKVCSDLLKAQCPPQYSAVLAQISNNSSSVALKVLQYLLKQMNRLLAESAKSPPRSPLPTSPYLVRHSKKSVGLNSSGEKARMSMQSSFQLDAAVQKLFQEEADPFVKSVHQKAIEFNGKSDRKASVTGANSPLHGRRAAGEPSQQSSPPSKRDGRVVDSDDEEDSDDCSPPPSPKNLVDVVRGMDASLDSPGGGSGSENRCCYCRETDPSKRDQLVPCVQCHKKFHTHCFGARRIPFTLKTDSEAENRARYIARHYGDWRCSSCKASRGNNDKDSNTSNSVDSRLTTGAAPFPSSQRDTPASSSSERILEGGDGVGTSTERLLAVLSEKGLTVEELIRMSSSERQHVMSEASGNTSQRVSSQSRDISDGQQSSPAPPVVDSCNQRVTNAQEKGELLDPEPSAISSTRSVDATGDGGRRDLPEGEESEWKQVSPSDDPRYTKYFNMLKAGLPLSAVAEKMRSDGLAATASIASNVLKSNAPRRKAPNAAQRKESVANQSMLRNGTQASVSRDDMITAYPLKSSSSLHMPAASSCGDLPSQASDVMTPDAQSPSIGVEKHYTKDCVTRKEQEVGNQCGQSTSSHQYGSSTTQSHTEVDIIDQVDINSAKKDIREPIEEVSVSSERNCQKEQCIKNPESNTKPIGSNNDEERGDKATQEGSHDESNGQQEVKKGDGGDSKAPVVMLQDSVRYGKYFRMLKVGLPVKAIKMKMTQAGLDPDILDRKPTDPLEPTASNSDARNDTKDNTDGCVGITGDNKNDPTGKENKEDNILTSDVNDNKDPGSGHEDKSAPEGEEEEGKEDHVPLKEHPVYAKYFKMLQVGLPLVLVREKLLAQEEGVAGIDPSVLEKPPTELYPRSLEDVATANNEDEAPKEEMVALQEHPAYAKFLKMRKVGMPLMAVKKKMSEEGYDPDLMDKDPSELVPVDVTSTLKAKSKKSSPKVKSPSSPKQKRVRKKKLHWKAIDASKVGADSLWAEDDLDGDISLDTDEFNSLFVQSEVKEDSSASKANPKEASLGKKKQQLHLIDMKRGQNGGIALARLKLPFKDVVSKILQMDETAFSAAQFRSLQEFLPSAEESAALRSFQGESDLLGVAEKYMLEVISRVDAPDIAFNCLECVLFKLQFRTSLQELNSSIARVENACDDVKMSPKLKKVLKTILKVGNQMNDGEEQRGYSLDSLLKLQSAKAFDKKTSVLQYIVRLIHRNDESCLFFPEDLVHLPDAARISIETLCHEKDSITASQRRCSGMVESMRDSQTEGLELAAISEFLLKAEQSISSLEAKLSNMRKKFESVLSYFGEEPSMPSHEFFATLQTFVDAFLEERAVAERFRKSEQRRASVSSRQTRSTTINSIDVDSAQLLRRTETSAEQSPLHRAMDSKNINSPNKPLPRKAARRNSTFI